MPDWDLLEGFPEEYGPNVFFSPGTRTATLSTSRGCPFGCRFCDQSIFGNQFRAFSPEWIVGAIEHLQDRYGIRYVIFCDDTFTLDRQRVIDFCRLARHLKEPFLWTCDANVMTIDRELLREMKRAGCWSISYGLESGSERVLASLNKRIQLDRAQEVVCLTQGQGIHAKGLFIIGTPEESHETIRATRRFVESIPLSTLNISKFTPYPGSALYEEVRDLIPKDRSDFNGMNFVISSKHLSIAELEREYSRSLQHFYRTIRAYRVHLPIMFGKGGNLRRLLKFAGSHVGRKFGLKTGKY
jgi:radical SAM superfamily enzyme YgiQ (UPF0313 family)